MLTELACRNITTKAKKKRRNSRYLFVQLAKREFHNSIRKETNLYKRFVKSLSAVNGATLQQKA